MSSVRWSHVSVIVILFSLIVNHAAGLHSTHAQSPTRQVVESDAPEVEMSGHWQTQTTHQANGGSYRYSSGAEEDVLTLSFSGPSIEVLYIAGPALGTLAIDVDGTVLRTVITTADQTAYTQSARIDYLDTGAHTLKVYAQAGGIIAIDAFVIHADSEIGSGVGLATSDEEGGTHASTCTPPNAIHRVSVNHVGGQATGGNSFSGSISSNGRFVAFITIASLVPGDGDAQYDAYVYDRMTCAVQLVSVSTEGVKANNLASDPSISADGRYVAFVSDATNLVAGDSNAQSDVFVHDRQTGQTSRVSVGAGGTQATGGRSVDTSISADGRYVAFLSGATNLVAGDTNATEDIFVHDRQTGQTTRVSVATGGTQATSNSLDPVISADGRYVGFESFATNLVAGDTNGVKDVFLYDRNTAITTRVSVGTGGTQANGLSLVGFALSADGRFVAFSSNATNLITGDNNGNYHVYVLDRQTMTTTRVSVDSAGAQAVGFSRYPSISSDGRYVAFQSDAINLVSGDTNSRNDVFVHDRQTGQTTRISVAADGTQGTGDSVSPVFSADGRYVSFHANASNLVDGDSNGQYDVFVTPRQQATPDTLALFNPTFEQINLLDTLADSPAAERYTAFSAYVPPTTPGQWVMGDWDHDGLDSPGVYADGAFYFTNVLGETIAADWRAIWFGLNGPPVAGRFSTASNDCIGVVDSVPYGGVTIFALYFTCGMSGASVVVPLTFQWLSAPLPDPTFTGTFQFMAGDFNGDGLDSIAVRRNEFIAYGNVNPTAGPAIFDLAQYIGAPGTGDNGTFVVGDWDGNGLDSFGLFYQNGELFYRHDLDFNSGVYLNQSIGMPFGNVGVQVASWR
ncbi:MAG: hypothetical protein K8L91_28530 [Anaerolineae bacterium]|nr:hypothetical protein [Anaerolineae bacterium]